MAGELVEFANGTRVVVLNWKKDNVGVAVFGSSSDIQEGEKVKRTKAINSVPIGEELVGRVV